MELRPYQQEDVNFLSKRYAGALFNEQRTGKTPTALRTLSKKGCTKILIVCPASCILPWKQEYENWLGQPCVPCIGTRDVKIDRIEHWTNGLVISYDSLKATKKSSGLVDIILKQKPEAVIIDEAHMIKDRKTQTAEAVFKLSKITHKLALTATPAPNKPYDVWSILHFLFPKQFKSYWKFIDEFFSKHEAYGTGGRKHIEIGPLRPEKKPLFVKLLAQFAVQRKRIDVLPWLPQKDYNRIYLEPTYAQRAYLNELQLHYEIPEANIICEGVLDRLTRYRQICVSPSTLKLEGQSAKMEWLTDYAKDYPEKQTIVFTKFKSAIPEIMSCFKDTKYCIITGEVPLKKREAIRQDFQNKKYNVLIAQIDTCNVGLTLDSAEHIIFVDKYPPVSDIQQAEDRLIPTTKEKSKKVNVITELVLKGTYDEDIYDLIEQHASEIEIVNNFKRSINII